MTSTRPGRPRRLEQRHAVSARLRLCALGCRAAGGRKRSMPDDIPLPYRSLLVHTTDMTLYARAALRRPRGAAAAGHVHERPVVFPARAARAGIHRAAGRDGRHPDQESAPSAIGIRRQILKNDVPLGRLLRDGGVRYESRPKAFLSVTPNSEMMGVFWMREAAHALRQADRDDPRRREDRRHRRSAAARVRTPRVTRHA